MEDKDSTGVCEKQRGLYKGFGELARPAPPRPAPPRPAPPRPAHTPVVPFSPMPSSTAMMHRTAAPAAMPPPGINTVTVRVRSPNHKSASQSSDSPLVRADCSRTVCSPHVVCGYSWISPADATMLSALIVVLLPSLFHTVAVTLAGLRSAGTTVKSRGPSALKKPYLLPTKWMPGSYRHTACQT